MSDLRDPLIDANDKIDEYEKIVKYYHRLRESLKKYIGII